MAVLAVGRIKQRRSPVWGATAARDLDPPPVAVDWEPSGAHQEEPELALGRETRPKRPSSMPP
jgi:hypothetical protein